MDWSGILGFAIALGVISIVFLSAENVMNYLDRLFGAPDPSLNAARPRDTQK